MILGVAHQKGGVGKSTLSITLAYQFGMSGLKTLLVDADELSTSSDWTRLRVENEIDSAPFTVVSLTGTAIHGQVSRLNSDYDMIVIDAPPRNAVTMKSIMVVSDLVLVPMQPSASDVWALRQLFDVKSEVEAVRGEGTVKTVFLLNRVVKNTLMLDSVNYGLDDGENKILRTRIHQRQSIVNAWALGRTIFDYKAGMAGFDDSAVRDARYEFEKLAKELADELMNIRKGD